MPGAPRISRERPIGFLTCTRTVLHWRFPYFGGAFVARLSSFVMNEVRQSATVSELPGAPRSSRGKAHWQSHLYALYFTGPSPALAVPSWHAFLALATLQVQPGG